MNVNALTQEVEKARKLAPEELNLIQRAFDFAQKAHQNQKRKSGEPYFIHCFETAFKVAEWRLDAETVAAALLHDTVEDAGINLEEIKKNSGKKSLSWLKA